MHRAQLAEQIQNAAGITGEQAERVLDYYQRIKVVRVDPFAGYKIRHGALLDRDVIRGALEEALEQAISKPRAATFRHA